MYTLSFSSKFKRDYKTIVKRGYSIYLIVDVFQILEIEGELPGKYLSHKLTGNYLNCWECHIRPDWLIIWERDDINKEIKLVRTGTHSDLF